ncbi:MAG: MerC domain-containing protein [Woeseia sp.]
MDDNYSGPAGWLDRASIALSGICLMHCLALPLMIALMPILAQFREGHFHVQLLVVVLPASVVAFMSGYRRHGSKGVIAWGVAGALLLVAGGTIAHDAYGIVADRALTICGALILAVAHYFNNRYSRHRSAVLVNA